ncbi:MAG: 2-dehydro-3-deoxyphosphogluconate aldolase, partial [Rhodospirillaceae bacterium]|nr:2-dehydro-3-deoxyphosphogluconate aldolase [Rhodospirillaceae bacterium]
TGGVNKDNMMEYLSLPIVATIGGSWIATKQQIADKEWTAISNQAKEALTIASQSC